MHLDTKGAEGHMELTHLPTGNDWRSQKGKAEKAAVSQRGYFCHHWCCKKPANLAVFFFFFSEAMKAALGQTGKESAEVE